MAWDGGQFPAPVQTGVHEPADPVGLGPDEQDGLVADLVDGVVADLGDLIFQDGDKSLYAKMLEPLVGLLRPGGVLVTDNVLWNGEVVEGFVPMPTRDPASTVAIRAYNARLAAEERLFTTFLPLGDGVAVSVRIDD